MNGIPIKITMINLVHEYREPKLSMQPGEVMHAFFMRGDFERAADIIRDCANEDSRITINKVEMYAAPYQRVLNGCAPIKTRTPDEFLKWLEEDYSGK